MAHIIENFQTALTNSTPIQHRPITLPQPVIYHFLTKICMHNSSSSNKRSTVKQF